MRGKNERDARIADEKEIKRQMYIKGNRIFSTSPGREFLEYLDILFGYNDVDWEDADNMLAVKPHERRGMKMPLRFIHTCLEMNLKNEE